MVRIPTTDQGVPNVTKLESKQPERREMSATRKRIRELERALETAGWELELTGDARARRRAERIRSVLRQEPIQSEERARAELAYEVEAIVEPTEALCLRCLPVRETNLREVDGVAYCPVHGLVA